MNTQVYVVVKKFNHFPTFQPSLLPPPVVTWNAGSLHIEGVFTNYPTQYAYNSTYEIHGPFRLNGSNMFIQSTPNLIDFEDVPDLKYPLPRPTGFPFPNTKPFTDFNNPSPKPFGLPDDDNSHFNENHM